jgi:restriction system protein
MIGSPEVNDVAHRRGNDVQSEMLEMFRSAPWWAGPVTALGAYLMLTLMSMVMKSGSTPLMVIATGMMSLLAWVIPIVILVIWLRGMIEGSIRRQLVKDHRRLEDLRKLSWQEFEMYVGQALRQQGYEVHETGGGGPDGGVDLVAVRAGERVLVQCKHWKSWRVGAPVIRELYGVVQMERATRGMVVISGTFTREARQVAEGLPIELVDGPQLLQMLGGVVEEAEPAAARALPTTTSIQTPEIPPGAPPCPLCGREMVVRVAKRGANAGGRFWGCSAYPKCRGTLDLPPGCG